MTASVFERKPHAVLDLESRRLKALKIERLLELDARPAGLRMLEIGCGSGGIAHYFGTHSQLYCQVEAVDVIDNRLVKEGYRFRTVEDTRLPFPNNNFDVVITNHVIEHVGNEMDQHRHLAEVRRVMKPGGIGYLAVPNRWQFIEPHYRLAFLSWLPRRWRTPYLRLMRRGEFYDCEPLEMDCLERMLSSAGFRYENLCVKALRATLEIEQSRSWLARFAGTQSDNALWSLRSIIPTLIYKLQYY